METIKTELGNIYINALEDGTATEPSLWDSYHNYSIIVTNSWNDKEMQFNYYTGSAVKDVDERNAFRCLLFDVESILAEYDFETWVRDYGDIDFTAKEIKVYKKCVESAKKVLDFITLDDDLEADSEEFYRVFEEFLEEEY